MTDPAVSPLDVDLARKRHVLAVAGDVTSEEVEALAVAKYPGAYWSEPDVLTLTEQVHLSGPFLLDGAARRGLGLPGGVAHAYLLTCPRERGGPVPPELAAVGGVLAAFADAALEGGEAHAVDVLMAMSRRLGALVRTSTGYLLEPEEWAGVDLRVYAPVWLYPDALVHVLHSTLPGIQVPDEPRTGPLPPGSPREASQLADRSGHDVVQLDDSERAWLHAEADAFDAHALAEPEVLESYGANWSYPSGGVITVSVEPAHQVPPGVLAGLEHEPDADDGAMVYELRWHPDDPMQWRQDPPPAVLRSECADARARIEAAAAALTHATGGQATDDDEFLIQL
ncbi:MAG TPA: hypothetical protein VK086_00990 [Ruania sp.]|nr:hypothetical protein [Ruania sp.]